MWPWLKRMLGAQGAPQASGPAVRAAPAALPPTAGPVVLAAAAAAALAESAQVSTPGFGPRRPLVGRAGQVAGFELLLAPSAERFLASRGDTPGAAVHHAALLSAAAMVTGAGRAALLRMPAAMLVRPKVAAGVTPGMWLRVDDLAALPAASAASLRSQGALLGVADGPPTAALPVDFVVVEAGRGGLDTLLLSAQRWREVQPRVAIVGLGLEHLEDMEAALQGGIHLAGGHLGRGQGAPAPRPLGAAAHRICELLNHLALDKDTDVVAQAVRGDAALTYRLLRYANSPAIGLKRGVETVDVALQLLGRRELQRWLSVQLISAGAARQAARALEESALVRGRLLELVAEARQEAHPGAHFTLGLLSVIEPLLQLPLAEAIEPLRLSDAARQALLERSGPWADRLALLDAVEAGDPAEVEPLARALGLEAAMPAIVDEAWGWAAQLGEGGAPTAV